MWGPTVWSALHVLSFAYPERPTPEDRRSALGLVRGVIALLPCEECRRHGAEYLLAKHHDWHSREAFARWVYDFHQSVNRRIGGEARASAAPSFEQTRKRYRAMLGAGCDSKAGCRIIGGTTNNTKPHDNAWVAATVVAAVGVLCLLLLARR